MTKSNMDRKIIIEWQKSEQRLMIKHVDDRAMVKW